MKITRVILGLVYLLNYPLQEVFSQSHTGNISGTVVDKQSQSPLPGVNITVLESEKGTASNADGQFVLEGVTVGRVDLKFSMIGYEPLILRNLVCTSGKYLQVNAEMQEKVEKIEEVVIKAGTKDKPLNTMAMVSARSFSVEETEKYAGSLGDPSRMVANYAGVVVAGDQRNDIIIRGNSPLGLLWRLDGINIPNPNHFGTMGTTGGPISILNNNQLDNSDFFTGAFPAQYGNALSGVFDLKLRNGNNQKREYMAQMGMNGYEVGGEGPFTKGQQASYMINYRYTMLRLMQNLGILQLAGTPIYQDLSSKFYFPTKKAGIFSLVIMGGDSHISLGEAGGSGWTADMPDSTRAIYSSGMGVAGLHHRIFLSDKSRLETTIAYTRSYSSNDVDTFKNGIFRNFYMDHYSENCFSFSSIFHHKTSARRTFQAGGGFDTYMLDYHDELYSNKLGIFVHPTLTKTTLSLYQAYLEWKNAPTEKLTFVYGLHGQWLNLNNSTSLEPRLSLRWNFAKRQSLGIGYGLHSQMQPRLVYFLRTLVDTMDMNAKETNRSLGFSKSHQLVTSYDFLITANLRLKVEGYYQYLYHIPVEQKVSYFSMANYGAKYYNSKVDSLVNKGFGRNFGIEFTLEKFLSHHYYFLFTTSLYKSTYRGSDKIWRNTEFNGNFTANALAGYELQIKNSLLSVNLRTVWAGGKRYVPLNYAASVNAGKTVYDYSLAYTRQFPDYFRMDCRLSWRMNQRKISQELSIDIQNFTNHRNILTQDYNSANFRKVNTYQIGFFPVGAWRIYF